MVPLHTAVDTALAVALAQAAERSHGQNLGMANAVTDFPWPPGYCSAGVVEAVGSEVKRFKAGDRVAAQVGHRSLGNASESVAVHMPEGVAFEKLYGLECFLNCLAFLALV